MIFYRVQFGISGETRNPEITFDCKFINMLIFYFRPIKGLLLLMILLVCSCKSENNKFKDAKVYFKGDSSKTKAVEFLIENVKDHYSLVFYYKDRKGKVVDKKLVGYLGNDPDLFLDSVGAILGIEKRMDSTQISVEFLINDVENAYSFYENNPMGLKVEDDIFYNYVLPYRVGYEELNDWRVHFNTRYWKYIETFAVKDNLSSLLRLIQREQNIWFHPYQRLNINDFTFSPNLTFNQMLALKYPRSCEDYSIYYLYVFRSLGIPAAYEVIPLWGKFNYGHSETSIMDKDGVFYPARLNDTAPFKYQIAKMYRRQFEKVENPYDQIKKTGIEEANIPDYFNQPDLIDITQERTEVSDIVLGFSPLEEEKVGYLCIYNAGKWKEVEWAEYNDTLKGYEFKNMGRKILYHLSTYKNGKQVLLNEPFILDTVGMVKKITGKEKNLDVRIYKNDRHSDLEKGIRYKLKIWDASTKSWRVLDNVIGNEEGVYLKELPINALFLLEETGFNADAVRPFTINNNNSQIWW